MSESIKSVLADAQALTANAIGQLVPVVSLFRRDNVRTKATLQIPGMVASLKRHGFKPNHPLVVSAKPDNRFLVLCGNRRMEAIETIAATEPDTFVRLFPTGDVPCIVFSGLTEADEANLRIDHGTDEDRVGLDDWGYFLAIRQLVRAGYDTQAGIAEKIGWFKKNAKTGEMEPNRSLVQQRVNLCQLPTFVQAEFEALCMTGRGATNVRWGDVAGLYKAFNEDYKAGIVDGSGPTFQAAWSDARKSPDAKATTISPITPADLIKRSKVVGSATLRNVLAVCGGATDSVTLAELDGRMVQAETATVVLSEIAEYLGNADFAELTESAHSAAIAKLAGGNDSTADAELAEVSANG